MAGYGGSDDHIKATQNHIDDSLALHRMKMEQSINTSGVCLDCGDPISKVRLLAIPHCKRCIDCQEEWESAQRGFNRFQVKNHYVS